MRPRVFERELAGYPATKLQYILDGLRFGFRIGWSSDRGSLRSRSTNLKSVWITLKSWIPTAWLSRRLVELLVLSLHPLYRFFTAAGLVLSPSIISPADGG